MIYLTRSIALHLSFPPPPGCGFAWFSLPQSIFSDKKRFRTLILLSRFDSLPEFWSFFCPKLRVVTASWTICFGNQFKCRFTTQFVLSKSVLFPWFAPLLFLWWLLIPLRTVQCRCRCIMLIFIWPVAYLPISATDYQANNSNVRCVWSSCDRQQPRPIFVHESETANDDGKWQMANGKW